MKDRETWYRTPHSAEECAVHLEAGGAVEWRAGAGWAGTRTSAQGFRNCARLIDLATYRLVYHTPVGMSPVIGAPGHAYGLAEQAPEGWETRGYGNDEPFTTKGDAWKVAIIEARPPVPPRTELVPLTKLVGRVLVGETEAVSYFAADASGMRWALGGAISKPLPVTDDGMVEVLAGDA